MQPTILPDPFHIPNLPPLDEQTAWPAHRQQLLETVIEIEYGTIPPPAPVSAEILNTHTLASLNQARHTQYRLNFGTDPGITMILDLTVPSSENPLPLILNGDGCWGTIKEDIRQMILDRGYILAVFNRTEIVPDHQQYGRDTGLYKAYPSLDFGALAAWAWGYHRAVDFLLTLPEVDPGKIAISGHSRGGKAVLLAGAADERIALTNPNGSGCGGAGCFRIEGQGSETLKDILRSYSYWFHPSLENYIGLEHELPFDQHFLKAAAAPRSLLTTEALGDLWANPFGTWHSHSAAREVFRFLDVEDKIGIRYREGGHAHNMQDFNALLDFADWQLSGKRPVNEYNHNPF